MRLSESDINGFRHFVDGCAKYIWCLAGWSVGIDSYPSSFIRQSLFDIALPLCLSLALCVTFRFSTIFVLFDKLFRRKVFGTQMHALHTLARCPSLSIRHRIEISKTWHGKHYIGMTPDFDRHLCGCHHNVLLLCACGMTLYALLTLP